MAAVIKKLYYKRILVEILAMGKAILDKGLKNVIEQF